MKDDEGGRSVGKQLKTVLASGRVARVFGLGQLSDPKLVEMIGLAGGWDAVWFDQEHAGLTTGQVELLARACRLAGLDSFARMAPTDYATVMRPLEAGAGGIMAAQVRSAAQAADIVSWSKFHPAGLRGLNSSGVDGRFGSMKLTDYMAAANAETFVAIQIEHVDAVREVEGIAAVKEVDVLFVGPADLSQSLGIPGQFDHPRMWECLMAVAAAAQRHGIHWAILPPYQAYARRCVDLGCRMLSLGLDTWTWSKGLQVFKNDYAEFFSGQ
jgi:2-dehydro-3-deoxyglucarate aldolase/4-hydroxy-2-oxoheptanedioate aldolase